MVSKTSCAGVLLLVFGDKCLVLVEVLHKKGFLVRFKGSVHLGISTQVITQHALSQFQGHTCTIRFLGKKHVKGTFGQLGCKCLVELFYNGILVPAFLLLLLIDFIAPFG